VIVLHHSFASARHTHTHAYTSGTNAYARKISGSLYTMASSTTLIFRSVQRCRQIIGISMSWIFRDNIGVACLSTCRVSDDPVALALESGDDTLEDVLRDNLGWMSRIVRLASEDASADKHRLPAKAVRAGDV